MTISLRSLATSTVFAFAALTFAGCKDLPVDPTHVLRPGSAATADRDRSERGPRISPRYKVDSRTGTPQLESWTGDHDYASDRGTPNGYHEKLEYTVFDGKNHRVLTRTIHFGHANVQHYIASIDLCGRDGDANDDDDRDDRNARSCRTKASDDWHITVTATIRGWDGDDRTKHEVSYDISCAPGGSVSDGSGSGTGGLPSTFPWGVFATGNLTITGNAGTDSYSGTYDAHHPRANGNVAVAGNMTMTGSSASVKGSATIGGTLRMTGHPTISGGATEHATLPMLATAVCPAHYSPASQVPDAKHVSYNANTGVLSLTGNATLTLAPGTYYFSQISATGNADLVFNASGSQRVTIYVGDRLSLTGGNVVNESMGASNVAFVACGGSQTDWSLTGNTKAYFCVYAPKHDVSITGNGDLFGALVGKDVSFTGNATLHFDESSTANGACGGVPAPPPPPQGSDVSVSAANSLQLNIGNGPRNIGAETIYAGANVELDQWVQLLSGPAPGVVTCTITIAQGTTTLATLTGTTSPTDASSSACKVNYTFTTAGSYTVTSSVAVGRGITGARTGNKRATNTVTIAAAVPSANVVVSSLAFTDANVQANQQVFSPTQNAAADTIHSGDEVTYAATISASNILNVASVPSVTCSATDNGTDISNSVTWVTRTISNLGTSAQSCSFKYTITRASNAAESHTIGVSIQTTGITNTATTGTSRTGVITLPALVPQATIAIEKLTFTDDAESITNRQFSPVVNALGDTVHSGDLASYSATVSLTQLQNASAGPTITCSATVDGTPVTSGWTQQTISPLTNNGSGVCTFTRTINETDNAMHPHSIQFSISTGTFKNNAAASATTATGTINAVRRVDFKADPIQLLDANGAVVPMSNGVKQGATATLQVPLTNLNASAPTTVTCSDLVLNAALPDASSPFTLPAADVIASDLRPTLLTTSPITLAANGGTGFCKYQIIAPADKGLINVSVLTLTVPTATSPSDPVPANNISTGTIVVKSSGAFTVTPKAQDIVVNQSWSGGGDPVPTTGTLTSQQLWVKQLALLVVPTNEVVGVFGMEVTVYSKNLNGDSTSFGTGVVTFQPLQKSLSGTRCDPTHTIATNFLAAEPQLSYDAQVCTSPAVQPEGFQQITVAYNLTSGNVPGSASPLLFGDTTTVKIKLRFNLDPLATQANDSVSAVIKVPLNLRNAGCTYDDLDPNATICNSSFKPAIISTP